MARRTAGKRSRSTVRFRRWVRGRTRVSNVELVGGAVVIGLGVLGLGMLIGRYVKSRSEPSVATTGAEFTPALPPSTFVPPSMAFPPVSGSPGTVSPGIGPFAGSSAG